MKVNSTLIRDTIDLYQGETLITSLPFKCNVTKTVKEVQNLRAEMIARNAENDLESTGKAFYRLLQIVFGEDNVEQLDEWYEGDYLSMLNDLAPILTEQIYPAYDRQVEQIVQTRKRIKA